MKANNFRSYLTNWFDVDANIMHVITSNIPKVPYALKTGIMPICQYIYLYVRGWYALHA